MSSLLIMRKRIDLASSPVFYDAPFSAQSLSEDWLVRSGQWDCQGDVLMGRNPLPQPGCIELRRPMPGNVLIDFHARTVPPCTHDIDVMWNMTWDEQANRRGVAYVAGVQGWWEGKVGIEKSPEYKLTAAAPSPWFRPGQDYHIQAGSIEGHCFLFVDGQLRLELLDDDPIDSQRHVSVGFEAYQSMIAVWDVTIRRIQWEPRELSYPREF
jgi:hypothetical protein